MVTMLLEGGPSEVAATAEGDALWLDLDTTERTTGWALKPEGLCRGPICVPVPPGRHGELVRADAINVAAFWRLMGKPVLHDAAGEVWLLGEDAASRAEAMRSLEAPDFTLPDLDGRPHRLSDYRGKKVLLVTWASW
jgi:hypothetical protein